MDTPTISGAERGSQSQGKGINHSRAHDFPPLLPAVRSEARSKGVTDPGASPQSHETPQSCPEHLPALPVELSPGLCSSPTIPVLGPYTDVSASTVMTCRALDYAPTILLPQPTMPYCNMNKGPSTQVIPPMPCYLSPKLHVTPKSMPVPSEISGFP